MAQPIRASLLTAEHLASVAWSKVRGMHSAPQAIEVLKRRSVSRVYRLVGAGPDGSNVIAKRSPTVDALAEREVYVRILPSLPFRTLRHYGLVEEKDGEFCWAFVEDAGTMCYSPDLKEHRLVASEWLALLHTAGSVIAPARKLPDRSPCHYRSCLRSGRSRILENIGNPALGAEGREVLTGLLQQCEVAEEHWSQIEQCCELVAPTFVHSDLHTANIRVAPGPHLLPFDWEAAGWGTPAVDLSLAGLELPSYCGIMQRLWPRLNLSCARRLVLVGQLFRLLSLIDWESRNIACEWLHRPLKHMAIYRAEMSGVTWGIEQL